MLITVTDTAMSPLMQADTLTTDEVIIRTSIQLDDYNKTIEVDTLFDNYDVVEDTLLLEMDVRNALADSQLSEQEIKQAITQIDDAAVKNASRTMQLLNLEIEELGDQMEELEVTDRVSYAPQPVAILTVGGEKRTMTFRDFTTFARDNGGDFHDTPLATQLSEMGVNPLAPKMPQPKPVNLTPEDMGLSM